MFNKTKVWGSGMCHWVGAPVSLSEDTTLTLLTRDPPARMIWLLLQYSKSMQQCTSAVQFGVVL
eukprot:m.23548 g.23548  ORF g.23548 m.23548 type:complete len:64 (+) comp11007_c0_seq1:2095-2286(+)